MQLKSVIARFHLVLLSLILTAFVVPTKGSAYPRCDVLFRKDHQQLRSWSEVEKLTFLTFNVANIYRLQGKYQRVSATKLVPMEQFPPRPKSENQVQELQKIMTEINPDIAVLTEVESADALQRFSRQFSTPYRNYFVAGNDMRIGMGFIFKSDLPIDIEVQSHRDLIWRVPVTRERIPLFTRDLPVFILRKNKGDPPFMIVFGMHAISKRGRDEDPQSNFLRTAQFEKTAEIIKEYQKKFGKKVPMMIAGDFNTNVIDAKEMDSLREISESAFNIAQNTIPVPQRVTHTFHQTVTRQNPRTSQKEEYEITHRRQLDDIRFVGFPEDFVLSARVHRYTDENGIIKPFARSYQERLTQTSDHLPVVVEISTEGLQK